MARPEWRVYYDDETTADSESHNVANLPARGVLAIVQPDDDVGRIVISGHDYYCYRPDEGTWYGVFESFGLWDYLAAPGWKRVLFGRTADTATYRAAYQRAIEDDDFPTKTAWDGEREQERERPPGVSL